MNKISEFEKYHVNPSAKRLGPYMYEDPMRNPKIAFKSDSAKGKHRVTDDQGNVIGLIGKDDWIKWRDSRRFFKFYLYSSRPGGELKPSFRFSDLSKPGLKMLDYIFEEINISEDYIRLIPDLIKKEGFITHPSDYYRGVTDLLAEKIIFRGDIPYFYFINVEMFFAGNSSNYYKEYINKEK